MLVVIGVAWLLLQPLFTMLRVHLWKKFINALRVYDPDMYRDLGDPKCFFLQKLIERNPLANDRLLYQVLINPALFQSHPSIKKAADSYRIIVIVDLNLSAVAMIMIAFALFKAR